MTDDYPKTIYGFKLDQIATNLIRQLRSSNLVNDKFVLLSFSSISLFRCFHSYVLLLIQRYLQRLSQAPSSFFFVRSFVRSFLPSFLSFFLPSFLPSFLLPFSFTPPSCTLSIISSIHHIDHFNLIYLSCAYHSERLIPVYPSVKQFIHHLINLYFIQKYSNYSILLIIFMQYTFPSILKAISFPSEAQFINT